MHFYTSSVVASTLISVVSAATFNVTVGQNNQNTYNPSFHTGVQNGDSVLFQFVSKSHSVTQSTFDQPCVKKANGIDSGLISATNSPEWSTNIDDASAPLWFYCIPHCSLGMVFAINPTTDNTFDAFSAAAKGLASGTTSSVAPGASSTTSTAGSTTSPSADTTSLTTTSTTVIPTATAGSAGQVSADKITLWLSALCVLVGLTL